MVTGALSRRVKLPGHEPDHSPPPNAEDKNPWRYPSTPPYVFMVWCLIKNRYVFMAWYLVKQRDNLASTSFEFKISTDFGP
jgi:hypothetical protein